MYAPCSNLFLSEGSVQEANPLILQKYSQVTDLLDIFIAVLDELNYSQDLRYLSTKLSTPCKDNYVLVVINSLHYSHHLLTDVGSVEVRYQRGEGAAITCLGVSAVLRVVRLSDGSASDSSEDEALLHPSLTLQRCISCTRLIRFSISSQSLCS